MTPFNKRGKFIALTSFSIAIILVAGLVTAFYQTRSIQQTAGKTEFDYGLVWFGTNGRYQKAVAHQQNHFFDPEMPTIIFIHGWMPDQAGEPPTFMVDFPDQKQGSTNILDAARGWVEAGWNIGIFYWHPFSDEAYVWDAEDKIWTSSGSPGMRYRDAEGTYYTEGVPSVSVTDLLLDAYLASLEDFSGAEIRIAGHSLGNQLAVNLAAELIEQSEAGVISENIVPSRIALLDPFWSPFPKTFLDGLETGEVIQEKIKQTILPEDILVEWYHSSWLTESAMIREDIPDLKARVVYAELDPQYCDLLDPICKHDGAWHLYFLSYGVPPPPECIPDETSNSCEPTGQNGPMASTSNLRMAEMMSSPYYWIQGPSPDGIDGRLTPQIDDDWFLRLPQDVESE